MTNTKLTKEERLAKQKAALLAKLAIVEAKENGTYQIKREGVKALKFALRTRRTALHAAQVLVNGRAPSAKSPALPTIVDKIKNAEKRLAGLIEGRDRAIDFLENLPADIDLLEGLVTVAESGDSNEPVKMPTGLFHMDKANETDVEVETRAAVEQAESN